VALRWLNGCLRGTDGVVAKRLDLPYMPGERSMLKIKRIRTADCVVGGFRYEAARKVVGSLLLGLFDNAGKLHHVGFTSALSDAEKPKLTKVLEKLIAPPGFTGDAPGAPSRWSTARSTEWQPLKPKLVAEVGYDHVTGRRFRHGTRFIRWRPDKSPKQCTFTQIGADCLVRRNASAGREVDE
jgi:ATP-dependent DNA ligase